MLLWSPNRVTCCELGELDDLDGELIRGGDLMSHREPSGQGAAASAMAGLRTAVTNSTYKDNLGSCQVGRVRGSMGRNTS